MQNIYPEPFFSSTERAMKSSSKTAVIIGAETLFSFQFDTGVILTTNPPLKGLLSTSIPSFLYTLRGIPVYLVRQER